MPTEVSQLQDAIQNAFKEGSLNILKNSGGQKALFAQKVRGRDFQIFRLTGHFRQDSPDEKKGGFHRGSGSIFINFEKVPADEWLVIFIHEFAHGLDSELVKSLNVYANPIWIRQFTELAINDVPVERWPEEARQNLHIWLRVGLNRGYLAEYRAWATTFALYIEGLADGTFKKVDWLEEILQQKHQQESLRQFTLRFLSPGFEDPTYGPFQYPVIQKELKKVRQELLRGEPPTLGDSLDEILSKTK